MEMQAGEQGSCISAREVGDEGALSDSSIAKAPRDAVKSHPWRLSRFNRSGAGVDPASSSVGSTWPPFQPRFARTPLDLQRLPQPCYPELLDGET